MAGYPARPFRGQVRDSELACRAVLSACGAEAVWARRGSRLSEYGADDEYGYEDRRGDHEQSTDDLFVQGAAAMIASRVVLFGIAFSPNPECRAHRQIQRQSH